MDGITSASYPRVPGDHAYAMASESESELELNYVRHPETR